ncbi:MAG: hypothetical protein ACK449_14635 [Planctomycetota bacterium]
MDLTLKDRGVNEFHFSSAAASRYEAKKAVAQRVFRNQTRLEKRLSGLASIKRSSIESAPKHGQQVRIEGLNRIQRTRALRGSMRIAKVR